MDYNPIYFFEFLPKPCLRKETEILCIQFNFNSGLCFFFCDYLKLLFRMDNYDDILAQFGFPNKVHHYYAQYETFEKKNDMEKSTQDISNSAQQKSLAQESNHHNESLLFTNLIETQKNTQKNNRLKNKISVNLKRRHKYLLQKKGKESKTTDLSVNIATMIKASFEEFQTFFCSHQNQAEHLKQFKRAKPNLQSIRKLFGWKMQQAPSSVPQNLQMVLSKEDNELMSQNFKKFMEQYLRQPKVVQRFLKSKKMSFNKKIMLIKFMGALRLSCQFPQKLSMWKSLLE